MLVFLLLAGRYLQARQQQSAYDSFDILLQLTPRKARRIRDGVSELISSESLLVGDTIEVREGESFAADGFLIQGQTEVDQALLTGETLPVTVKTGDPVFAGTINRGSAIRFRVAQVGEDSRVGKLASTIERAAVQRTPLVQLADRLAGQFVLLILLVAAATACYCFFYRPGSTIDRVVSLLIVACPCALGLATPLAISLALGEAARRGILIRGGDALQRLANGGIILLDKTGTVTTGEIDVRFNDLADEFWPYVAALESKSNHPIAHALSRHQSQFNSSAHMNLLTSIEDLEYRPGGGMKGILEGNTWVVGNQPFMQAEDIVVDATILQRQKEYLDAGASPVFVARNNQIIGTVAVGDHLRADVAKVVESLRLAGWRVGLLSGDHTHIVSAIGKELHLDPQLVFGSKSPEEKQRVIQQLQQNRTSVVMVGDGVNDAVALAQADVGVAVKGGAEISLQAASIYLKNAELNALLDLSQAGKNTISAVRRNFVASVLYNIFSVGLAVAGVIHPLVAAGLMPVSSITVVGITLASHVFPKTSARKQA
jgi:Cu2+-exporting ATPase